MFKVRETLKIISILMIALFFVACKKGGGSQFDFAGDDSNLPTGAPVINSYFPQDSTVILCVSQSVNPRCGTTGNLSASSTQTFSVSATGAPPISYTWRLDGNIITGAEDSIYSMVTNPTGINAGVYTLSVTATNDSGSATHTFNVKVNEPPSLSSPSPSNSSDVGINLLLGKTLTVAGSDANSDTITYRWKLDNQTVARLVGVTTVGGAQGTLTPVAGDVGDRVIKVEAVDTHESASGAGLYVPDSIEWTVNINYFSEACNNLQTGGICTAVGRPGMLVDLNSDGVYSGTADYFKMRPNSVIDDGSGNLFISDSDNHVIWFHNRSGAQVERLGTQIGAGEIAVLVGNGAAGKTTDDSATYSKTAYKLNGPQDMFYDSANDYLYIADYYNHRVVRIDSDGLGRRVFGNEAITPNNSTTNGNDLPAIDHICAYPMGLVVNSTKTTMYVSCTGNGTNNVSAIKEINMTDPNTANWTAKVAVGRVNASGTLVNGATDGTAGYGTTTAQVIYPWALALDQYGNLYFTSNNSQGTLRVLKKSASPANYFNGAVASPAVGAVATLLGGNNDAPSNLTDVSRTAARWRDARGLAIKENGGAIEGFFLSIGLRHMIIFINNSAGALTYGDNSINSGNVGIIWGVYNDADTAGTTKPATSNRLYYPNGLLIQSGKLLVADTFNFQIRSLDITQDNGNIATVTGGEGVAHSAKIEPSSPVPATNTDLYLVDQILHDTFAGANRMLFGDNSTIGASWAAHELRATQATVTFNPNYRIRSLDLDTGLVSTYLGSGYGNADSDPQLPTVATMRGVKGMAVASDGSLLYVDRFLFGGGGSRNCHVRVYNRSGATNTYFGISAIKDVITTIAGNYADGCNSSVPNASAIAQRMYYPEGIAISGSDLYISEYNRHCILKVDSSNALTHAIGSCGSVGDISGAFGTARFRYPKQLLTDPRFPTNFFIVDQTDQTTSSIKYVNLSGAECDAGAGNPCEVGGTGAQDQQVLTAFSVNGGYARAVAYYQDSRGISQDMICYSSSESYSTAAGVVMGNSGYGSNNVTCKFRQSGAQSLRIGSSDASILSSGGQITTEYEGDTPSSNVLSVPLNGPAGMSFDSDGNLYITEQNSHVIRKVKKWW